MYLLISRLRTFLPESSSFTMHLFPSHKTYQGQTLFTTTNSSLPIPYTFNFLASFTWFHVVIWWLTLSFFNNFLWFLIFLSCILYTRVQNLVVIMWLCIRQFYNWLSLTYCLLSRFTVTLRHQWDRLFRQICRLWRSNYFLKDRRI